ncbi:IS3 family transposase [Spiroplasma endosymbiont of Panzeria rudis]|uniref:IS3 family transposase n=1 Tax=Spiroplasma endosymbiont of Panzeria rudis TaxID=3066301 RepID=UPI003BAF621E
MYLLELIKHSYFCKLHRLLNISLELFDYINWYNNIRIHSTLNYLTPVNYQK